MKKRLPLYVCLFFLWISVQCLSFQKALGQNISETRQWWKEAIVYQVYPRSFKDSDGDGVGDLKGIISKLDYIKSLGIDVVWLNPIFASPNDDNGYDISDYRSIMKEFGTMEDFNALLKGMHDRKIKLILDLVANHCSDEHDWFKQSKSSRNNPYRDYFHWWPAERGVPNMRYSKFDPDGNAWRYDSTTNAYYLHYFSRKQPDLNWENPKLRKEFYNMMQFWFDKGVDGFRMDAITFIAKDTTFPPIPSQYLQPGSNLDDYYASGEHLHDYFKEMNREVLSKNNVMTVAEAPGVNSTAAHLFVDQDRHELNMLYHFEGADYGYVPGKFKTPNPDGWDLVGLKAIYAKWDSTFEEKGWGTFYLANHDQPRMVTRWGNDTPAFREVSSKMLTTFILTMRGTPYYYFGDELGMSNIKFDRINQYKDIETISNYKQVVAKGGDTAAFLASMKITSRDNSRTPFQWDNTANAGFTTGTPWLDVNENYKTVNVAAEEKDPASCLHYFRKAVQVRKSNKVLVYGTSKLVDKFNKKVYAYTRELDGKKVLVALNFTAAPASFTPGFDLSTVKILLGNYVHSSRNGILQPYEAVVYEIK